MGDFVMPSLGADMVEGTFIEWLVRLGDRVRRGDVIAVVETPKSAVEVECFEDGTVAELLAREGDVVPVGGVLARLETAAVPSGPVRAATVPAAPEPAAVMPATPAPVVRPEPAPPAPSPHLPPLSPVLRHRAHELGIDLATVTGTGRHGAVTRKDLERAAATTPSTPQPSETPVRQRVSPYARRLAREAGTVLDGIRGTGAAGAVTAADVRHAAAPARPQPEAPAARAAAAPARRADADSMRQSIAALMTVSNREIPHYYLSTTIDLTASLKWMRARNRELPVEQRLVPAALMLVAAARSARAVPDLNGHWVDGGFRPSGSVDLGLILSLRRGGLLVPAIARADSLGVTEMMAAVRELTSRARAGRLRGSDLVQPSITVSNLGDQGVESVLGVIYPPQVALVGLGAVSERPWAVEGLLGVRPLVTATLAGDHRASDGAVGARYLKHLDRLLQKPEEL
ncbi:dihydrolipoamide acetyltransferase family protein [Knoellia sp. p5-6-4]|uniref:dihydrolipoamide acetyltransferase family protein n=1 Tax=unclassified Knoellia TaxID=2618719 RepID=UPI0023DAE758|nr:dihydrolipoamide acetyltransferase family protein [Knoellia sp. p5-6-4]MDF2144206.1 dihydrolipoamide acetyltransferase family protein [Knoellia sp. p5-6-4]